MSATNNIEIKNRIITILSRLFAESGVDTDILEYVDLVDDLGMDSINFISLIIELEAEFDIQMPDEWLLMEKFRTYTLIYDAVECLLSEKEASGNNA